MSVAAPPPSVVTPTDAELLVQFADLRDEAAFRLLVERHARLVRTVCRRALWHEQDVEDAFQATFLVLTRSARAIRRRTSLAGWLFQVAHRTATRAALRRMRARERPLQADPAGGPEALAHFQQRELFEILAAELNRLPESYRTPLVLLYLEGKSLDAAADELDCTDAALKGRLARGRRLLRERLIRRGVTLSLALGAWAGAAHAAEAVAHAATISLFTAGQTGWVGSPEILSLAEGVLRMKSLELAKSAVVVGTLAVAGVLAGVGAGHQLWAGSGAEGGPVREAPAGEASLVADAGIAGTTITVASSESDEPRESGGENAGEKQPPEKKQAPVGPVPEPADLRPRSPAEQRIETALVNPAGVDILFVDIPLKDALDYLADQYHITIITDEARLQDEGISVDVPVNLTLSGISLQSALKIMLDQRDLTWIVEDEVMKVTTRTVAEDRLTTRVYPIKHLTDVGFLVEAIERVVRQAAGPKVPQGTWGGATPSEGGKDGAGALAEADGSQIEAVGDFLVVTQSQPAHRRVAELLDQLKRAAKITSGADQ